MSNVSYRLWYFEAHLPGGARIVIDAKGQPMSERATVIETAFVGTEGQAHAEADRRYAVYDATQQPPALAMSFSPLSTLSQQLQQPK